MSLDGDFASLRSAAAQALPNIRSAPGQSKETENAILSLNTLLDAIENDFTSDPSILKHDEALEQQLGVLINLCLASIRKINDAFQQSSSSEAIEAPNMTKLHDELFLRHNDLSDFVVKAGISTMAKTVDEVNGSRDQEAAILQAVDKILTDGSMPKETSSNTTAQRSEHSAVWRHVLVKLKLSGFKSSDVERHKTSIFHRLHESLQLHHHPTSRESAPHSIIEAGQHIGTFDFARPGHAPVRAPTMTYNEHVARKTSNRSSNYKPPAASTVYDSDDDDDAISIGSEASTLLGPIDEHSSSENYTLRSPTSPGPVPTATGRTVPRSSVPTLEIPDEKVVNIPSSPRDSVHGVGPDRGGYFVPMRPPPQRRTSAARPSSPREIDPRFYDARYHSLRRDVSFSRNTGPHPSYDHDTLQGTRSTSHPTWVYRRHGDLYAPHQYQSMDVQDDALPTAAEDGRLNEVDRLLREGRNIESFGSRSDHPTRNFYRTTALYRAAIQGHFEIVHLLLQHRANPNPRRSDGKSLMRLLARDGMVNMLRLLLEYGADIQRQGILPQAALFGHHGVVELLLEYGADINEVSRQTALYRAASNDHPQIVELLLQEGADIEFTTSGHSALYTAVKHGNLICVRLLLQYGARTDVGIGDYAETILHVASHEGNEAIVRELLRRGALPNQCNGRHTNDLIEGRRRCPLHFAAREGHLGTARLLLEYGANPNAQTEDGRGPVDIAIQRGHNEVRDLLSRRGGYPQLAVNDRAPGYRIQDVDSPHGSYESQVRRFSSSLPERPHRDQRRHSVLPASKSFENDPMRRERSPNGSRRGEQSSSSKVSATAALSLLASGVMMSLGGG